LRHNPYNEVSGTKGGDILVIEFDELKFRNEIKNMVRPFGLGKRQTEQIISHALLAVRRSSRPVRI
jgi:hypothetical protein